MILEEILVIRKKTKPRAPMSQKKSKSAAPTVIDQIILQDNDSTGYYTFPTTSMTYKIG